MADGKFSQVAAPGQVCEQYSAARGTLCIRYSYTLTGFPEPMSWCRVDREVFFNNYESMNGSKITQLYFGRYDSHRPTVKQSFSLSAIMKLGTLVSKFAWLWIPEIPA